MKKLIPWFCAVLSTQAMAEAYHDGIDAYRIGHYWQASSALGREALRDPMAEYYLGRMYLYGYGELKNNLQAMRYIKQSAEHGYVPAQLMMAKMALTLENSPTKALAWYKRAAEKGDVSAQYYCIAAYMLGYGTSKSSDSAERYAILTAKKDLAFGQYTLGRLFVEGKNKQNRKVGVAWLEKAAQQKYTPAILLLSKLYQEGNVVSQDLMKAEALLQKAKQLNPNLTIEVPATVTEKDMANLLSEGKWTTLAQGGYTLQGILNTWQNPQALEQNHYNPFPQLEFAHQDNLFKPNFSLLKPTEIPLIELYTAYLQSNSAKQMPKIDMPQYGLVMPKVTDVLVEKAILGDSTAQFALGQLYQQGVSVPKDLAQAIRYYNQSAAQQDLRAEYNLGLIYLQGENGTPDYVQAMGWLTDAAFKGSVDAQYVLGQISSQGYRNAQGELVIEPDAEQATAMFYLGAANDHARSKFLLAERLARESTQNLTVPEREKRFVLMQTLYHDAYKSGIAEAALPLAFFNALSDDKSLQAQAFAEADKAAGESNPLASFLLATLYDRGIGIDKSTATAVKYYRETEDNPVSAFILGTYAALGEGMSKDDLDAKRWLNAADSAGFSYAALNLAMLDKQSGQDFLTNLLKAQSMGNHEASLRLADYYLQQSNDMEHLNEAKAIYLQLAEKGDPMAGLKLGYMMEKGLGGPIDYASAAIWYQKAAEGRQPIAQYRLARINQIGLVDNQPNYTLAKKWYSASAQQSYVPAAVSLGYIYDTVDDNYQAAQKNYQQAAAQHDKVASYNLALIYEQGKGMPVDLEKAKPLYESAANQGYVPAMVRIAGFYLNGLGGDRDLDLALEWYQKAAEKKDREAYYALGLLSETGVGMPIDLKKAFDYYQQSASQGNLKATLALARMYQFGLGVAQNQDEAAGLYKTLAQQGNAYAAYQLASMAYHSPHAAADKSQVNDWLKLAITNGSLKAVQVQQWLNAQTDTCVSFVEPVIMRATHEPQDEKPELMYMGVVNEWNQGNQNAFDQLSHLIQTHPDYQPAQDAYRQLHAAEVWVAKPMVTVSFLKRLWTTRT